MFYVLQNESTASLRNIPILLTDAATGTTAMAGVNTASIYPYVAINGGAFIGGTGPVYESGFGQYVYQMHPAETATLGLAGIHITASGCRDYDAIAQIAAFNVYSASVGATAGDIWSYDISALTSPSAGYDLTQASSAAGATAFAVAQAVWDYDPALYNPVTSGEYLAQTRTEAYAASNNTYDIGNQVWNRDPVSSGDYLTGDYFGAYLYQLGTGATGYPSGGGGISAYDVWNYTLTSSSATADATIGNIDSNVTTIQGNTSNIAGTVWNATVASYSTNGTFGKNILTGIGSSITANITGNITGNLSGSVGSVSGAVGSVTGSVGSVTGNVGGNVVGSVASVTAPVSVATASMTGIAGTVWSVASRTITGGTITTVSDKTGYSLSGTQSFNLTGNITGNLSGSVGSVSGAVNSVTSAVTLSAGTQSSIANSVWLTNISGYGAGSAGNALLNAGGSGVAVTAGDIWTYNSRTLTSASGATAGDVWSYVLSNTATAGTNLVNAAAGGNGITAGDVWTYNIGGITNSGTAGKQLNDAAVSGSVVTIVNGPYTLNSTAEGTDGRIDILQDSVQTIELMLVNAFGSPINISGNYTVSVDIYDEASALVHSYTPTINYALGGILSFDLDTLVTAVIGRYSVVVSLTDGDVIQVGPIQILVRPL